MNDQRLLEVAGWGAIGGAAANLLSLVTFVAYFTSGDFGPLADLPGLLWAVFTIPVALALHVLLRSHGPSLSLSAAVIGIVGLTVIAILQAGLIAGIVELGQQSPIVISAGFGVGAWLVVANALGLRGRVFPPRPSWAGLIAGVGFLFLGLGYWTGGQRSPVSIVGYFASVLTYPWWQIWLGRWLLRSRNLRRAEEAG